MDSRSDYLVKIRTHAILPLSYFENAYMNIDQLYSRLKEGDANAEEILFENLLLRFRLFAGHKIYNAEEREEVIQKALVIVIQKHAKIEFVSSFAAWAHRVLGNEILKYYRTKASNSKLVSEEILDYEPPANWNPDPALKRKLIDCMKKLLRAYKRHARVLNLKYQGYKTDEICDRLDISSNHFYVIISRARSMLKHCLEKGDIK